MPAARITIDLTFLSKSVKVHMTKVDNRGLVTAQYTTAVKRTARWSEARILDRLLGAVKSQMAYSENELDLWGSEEPTRSS